MDKLFRAKSTIEQWRILQAVVDYGGYAKAADKLNKSQSSLNHAVAKLQAQLGISLLEVQGRKAILTQQGETMLRRARQVLQDIEALEGLAGTLNQGWEPEIRLAIEIIYPRADLYQTLKAFLPLSKGSRLKITNEVISGSAEAILEKKADIVISNIVPQGYLANTLTTVQLIAVCGANNCDIDDDEITLEQLANHLQIVIGETGVSENKHGWLKAEQRWTVANFQEAIMILQEGIGFCWLPEDLAQPYFSTGQLRTINIANYSNRVVPLNLVIPDRDSAGPATKLLEQLFYQRHDLDSDNDQ